MDNLLDPKSLLKQINLSDALNLSKKFTSNILNNYYAKKFVYNQTIDFITQSGQDLLRKMLQKPLVKREAQKILDDISNISEAAFEIIENYQALKNFFFDIKRDVQMGFIGYDN